MPLRQKESEEPAAEDKKEARESALNSLLPVPLFLIPDP